ncbi:MAG: DNA mismatch repair protein MutS, partial [Proteobacteria bacterium]|nr:DNA mismatch repair protein MutS [Pseudomonadota bacterium]
MGDFFELFFDDAVIAAKVLDITLTKRGRHLDKDIPMCGVPVHSSEMYLHKLIKNGYSVAICEQMETPEEAKKRGHKTVVRREVTRIVTPGTIFEESLLDAKESNYLCCIAKAGSDFALCWADVSLGMLYVETITLAALESELSRLSPKEILLSEKSVRDMDIMSKVEKHRCCITARVDSIFDLARCKNKLKQLFNANFLSGVSDLTEAKQIAAGVLAEYLEYTQKANLPRFDELRDVKHSNFVSIDKATRQNLELDKGQTSLSKVLDLTLTAAGGRLLALYLSSPLSSSVAINKRLNNIESLYKHTDLRCNIRALLRNFTDIERALSRINTKRGRPLDLYLLKDGLNTAIKIARIIHIHLECLSEGIRSLVENIINFDGLLERLRSALNMQIVSHTELQSICNFVRRGYDARLDELHNLKNITDNRLISMMEEYRKLTGINTLKIAKNNIIGYYVEVTPTNVHKMQQNPAFIHKQSLGSSIRYTTEELKQLEIEILVSDEKIAGILTLIFDDLCNLVEQSSEEISMTAQSVATLDVICALAEVAVSNRYVRPIVDDSSIINIIGGRHPVVEHSMIHTVDIGSSKGFVPNACSMDEQSNLFIITGPNMAGKSTFLRQVALICIMAQVGSFVPAESAHIGVIDKLHSRIGAADNIAQGQSTFMVEMLETAYILNNATNKSLIILDEVGRGTSTYDGLAIAWSVVENIHNNIGARTLFATHYHELTALETYLNRLECYTIKVQEWGGKIIFMHEVIRGKADKSYGIHVAELAGISKTVIARAHEILTHLESNAKSCKDLTTRSLSKLII